MHMEGNRRELAEGWRMERCAAAADSERAGERAPSVRQRYDDRTMEMAVFVSATVLVCRSIDSFHAQFLPDRCRPSVA